MKQKKVKIIIILCLFFLETLFLFLTIKSFSNKEIKELKETYEVSKKHFSMFINDGNDNYTEYTESNVFPEGYAINIEKSSCIDTKGNLLEGILSGSGNNITVTSNKTAYCYLYFDEMSLSNFCSKGDNLGSCLVENNNYITSLNDIQEGGLYRFTGTNEVVDDNYICFGTNNKEECTSDTDKYMYRIIGVNESGQLKLIKKEALNYTQQWSANPMVDTPWPSSVIYSNITGSYYLTNSAYMPNGWESKISETTWHYGNIKDELNSNYLDPNTLYETEINFSGTINSKVSLMYLHDYLYAKQTENSWLLLSNNDSGALSSNEWTMSYYGYYNSYYYAMQANEYGGYDDLLVTGNVVRPVFYLKSTEKYISGSGTINDPIMLNEPNAADTLIENVSSDVLWKSTLEDDGYRFVGTDPSNYICFGTADTSTCTSDTDKYMYRIIGIFEDSEGEQHLKLIKKEALNTAYSWHSSYTTATLWNASDLYSGINESYFLTNTDYSYMKDTNWVNKIATWDYTMTSTLYYDNYESSGVYGPNYRYQTVRTTYLHEMNRSSKTSQTCYFSSGGIADCSVGSWSTISSKIGLMYVSDYLLSLGETVLDNKYTISNNNLINGWMHIFNNDSASLSTTSVAPPSNLEWTMTRDGNSGNYTAWVVNNGAYVANARVDHAYSVRPVFYLTSDVKISGEGISTNPYIIS